MAILTIFLLISAVIILPGCGSQPKKLHFDPLTHIDCLLEDDEFVSERERVHAKDVARLRDAGEALANLDTDSEPLQIASDVLVQLFEAKLADIPVPIGSKPIKHYFQSAAADSQEIVLGYTSEQSVDEIALFYAQQMEQSGWYQTSSFFGAEQLLMFEKLDQVCVVSLREQEGWFKKNGYTQIILFRGER